MFAIFPTFLLPELVFVGTAVMLVGGTHLGKATAFTAHTVDKAVALFARFKSLSVKRFFCFLFFWDKLNIFSYILERFFAHLAEQTLFANHERIISTALQGGSVNLMPLSVFITSEKSEILTVSGSSKVL